MLQAETRRRYNSTFWVRPAPPMPSSILPRSPQGSPCPPQGILLKKHSHMDRPGKGLMQPCTGLLGDLGLCLPVSEPQMSCL